MTSKPCSECPFRKDSAQGWLGPYTVPDLLDFARRDIEFPCHKSMGTKNERICRGFLHYRNNTGKSARQPSRLKTCEQRTYRQENNCFETPMQLAEHHDIANQWPELHGARNGSGDSGDSETET